ncbi:MAG: hypothetical protein EZS28_017083, partial [Streblomastix strix]
MMMLRERCISFKTGKCQDLTFCSFGLISE